MNKQIKSTKQILSDELHTVVSNFTYLGKNKHNYPSEKIMENELIKQLERQGYEYKKIVNAKELKNNLKYQLEKLNKIKFTEKEWNQFYKEVLMNPKDRVLEKTAKFQRERVFSLLRDNGEYKNIYLVDDDYLPNNKLQIINQYIENDIGEDKHNKHEHRYDVTILVNGLPLIHIELKKPGERIREAFDQIKRYQRESFNGTLYEYVQIFVISNGTKSKYYSNTNRLILFKNKNGINNNKTKSDKFNKTIFWADQENNHIEAIEKFASTFLSRQVILPILLKYCVFDIQDNLLVMRPYQIAGCEAIINQIRITNSYNNWGKKKNGGYVWHTTGSGKTLTSFKAAQLASEEDYIDKVVFVVDRKDLDNQTMLEYDRFQKGAVSSTKNGKELEKRLKDEDPHKKVIVTTIQKLDWICRNSKNKDNRKIVFIFDECHRSQAGKMHKNIRKKFNKYCMFGFTGTPIFANEEASDKKILASTEEIFGRQLHKYTIVNGINDKNVLPFMVEHYTNIKNKEDKKNKTIEEKNCINFNDPKRIKKITQEIIDSFKIKTRQDCSYHHQLQGNLKGYEIRNGFNALLATGSIEMARLYYKEFKKQQKSVMPKDKLKIATIFSWQANEKDRLDSFEDGEIGCDKDGTVNTDSARDFMDKAITDYNNEFHTNFSTNGDGFQNYYKDVSERMKNKELDLLIVVNMFLTGFDARVLNTIWIDKPLNSHGIIQTMSRTNRIFNEIKSHGNIVCLRDMRNDINEALFKYGNEKAKNMAILKPYNEYLNDYKEAIKELKNKFKPGSDPLGKQATIRFIKLFSKILEIKNTLLTWEKFNNEQDNKIISQSDFYDYQSRYLDIRDQYSKKKKTDNMSSEELSVVFKIDLLEAVTIDVDYILNLIEKMSPSDVSNINNKHTEQRKSEINEILKMIKARTDIRPAYEIFEKHLNSGKNISQLSTEINKQYNFELEKIINKYTLDKNRTNKFMIESFSTEEIIRVGEKPAKLFKKRSRFNSQKNNNYQKNKDNVLNALEKILNKFKAISKYLNFEYKK